MKPIHCELFEQPGVCFRCATNKNLGLMVTKQNLKASSSSANLNQFISMKKPL